MIPFVVLITFFWWLVMLSIFFVCLLSSILYIYIFFGEKMPLHIFCPYLNWVICLTRSYMSCLYIWGINPFLVISFVNISSDSVGFLVVLLMAFFAVWKFLSLTRSHLFNFAFVSFDLGDRSGELSLVCARERSPRAVWCPVSHAHCSVHVLVTQRFLCKPSAFISLFLLFRPL